MIDRRTFLQSTAGLSVAAVADWGIAATDSSRVALVIGNGAYKHTQLVNPENDAAAMRDLFSVAGIVTDSKFNATRIELIEAIDRFGELIQRSETKLAIFYYAGHGAQLDWRNYLLPVDISVQSPGDVKAQCVDIGIILSKMAKTKDKTFVIILDACRDDPFKGTYRPEQKGLSQFDAPVGSLLAYSTSPGNVAADGSGKNGLYTEHLIQELSNRQARLEDALKRVRLKVRLASNGEQIPWETTSLENDVFIFHEAKKKLTESEMIRLLEADMKEWERIKGTSNIEDWKNYILKYPNGCFAEIAQTRLNNLLFQSANTKPASSTHAPQPSAIVIEAGKPPPQLFQPSENPNSAGRYPLGRKFNIGDEYGLIHYDMLSGIEKPITLKVTSVDPVADRVELNNGEYAWDSLGNIWHTPIMGKADSPRQYFPAELYIGKKWIAGWSAYSLNNQRHTFNVEFHIAMKERLKVPAGEFDCFVIEFAGWDTLGRRLTGKSWVVPGLNVCVKQEFVQRGNRGGYGIADGYLLSWARQQTMDQANVVPHGASRNLVIRNVAS